jgi:hypothetical protein
MRFKLYFVAIALLIPQSGFATAFSSDCFDRAAARWKVPARVLKAIARAESGGFHNIPEEGDQHGHNHQKLYGVMGLRDDDVLGHSLREAVAAARLPLVKVVQDPCANIEAAAALISSEVARGATLEGAVQRSWGESNAQEAIELFQNTALQDIKVNLRLEPKAAWCWRFWTRCEPEPSLPPVQEPETPSPQGNGGEFEGAEWDSSPNFTAGAINPTHIVLHTTEGNFNGAVSWLKNPRAKVSAHYVVRASDGFSKQLVKEYDRAWHARCWNSQAIGIEMEGFSKDSGSFTPALIRTVSAIVRHLSRMHGISANATRIVGHDAGSRGALPGTGLNNCNDHGDPGVYFNWSGFWRLL